MPGVLSGMHHPSDIKVGRDLADLFYAELKKSDTFKKDFEKYMVEISSKVNEP